MEENGRFRLSKICISKQLDLELTQCCFWDLPSGRVRARAAQGSGTAEALAGGAGAQPHRFLHQEAPSYRLKPTRSKLGSPIWPYQQSPLQNLEVEKDFKLCPNILFVCFLSSSAGRI